MNTLAAAAFATAIAFPPQGTLPNQFLQAELLADLNSRVDKYRKLVGTNLSQNYKQIKIRKVTPVDANAEFLNVKLSVRIREVNGLTGAVLSTKDGTARGRFRWGILEPARVCVAAGLQEFSCLGITSTSGVPLISGSSDAQAAARALQANFPKEICVPMWPTLSVADATNPEKTRAQVRHPPRPNKLNFIISLSNVSARHVKVKYSTMDGTAKAGLDYQPVTGEVRIESGDKSALVQVPILPREGNQGARRMTFRIWSPINGKLADTEAVGTILD